MKRFIYSIVSGFFMIALLVSMSWAQESPSSSAEGSVDGVTVTINYHSPKVKGRTIWGGLEPYDKVWRTGANNATTLEVSGNMKIGKNKVVNQTG